MITAADVLTAAQGQWTAASLDTLVGSLYSGRLTSPKTPPYAVVQATPRTNQYYTEGVSGAPYIARWFLLLTVYGIGEVATDTAGKSVLNGFKGEDLSVSGATLLHCLPDDGYPKLTQDPTRKQGEDVWQFQAGFEVALSGTI